MIGTRRRKLIWEDGDKATLMIRRFRCERCGRVHHELPDMLIPYKQHIAATIEKVYCGDHWDVCCDDNEIQRLYLWLIRVFLPMAASLYSPLPETGRVLLQKKILESSPGWLTRLVYRLVSENRWQTHFAVSSG